MQLVIWDDEIQLSEDEKFAYLHNLGAILSESNSSLKFEVTE